MSDTTPTDGDRFFSRVLDEIDVGDRYRIALEKIADGPIMKRPKGMPGESSSVRRLRNIAREALAPFALAVTEGPRAVCAVCGFELPGTGTLSHNDDGSHWWTPALQADTGTPGAEPLTAKQCGAMGLCERRKGHEGKHETSVDRALGTPGADR